MTASTKKSLSDNAIRRIQKAAKRAERRAQSSGLFRIVEGGRAFQMDVRLSFYDRYPEEINTTIEITVSGGGLMARQVGEARSTKHTTLQYALTPGPITEPRAMGFSWQTTALVNPQIQRRPTDASPPKVNAIVFIGQDDWTMGADVDAALQAFQVWKDSQLENMPPTDVLEGPAPREAASKNYDIIDGGDIFVLNLTMHLALGPSNTRAENVPMHIKASGSTLIAVPVGRVRDSDYTDYAMEPGPLDVPVVKRAFRFRPAKVTNVRTGVEHLNPEIHVALSDEWIGLTDAQERDIVDAISVWLDLQMENTTPNRQDAETPEET